MVTSRYAESGLRYVRVANDLRTKVLEGVYRPGERLPRQHDLAREHNVSFTTLKQALDLLDEEGFVVRKPGQGTYASLPADDTPVALVVDDDRDNLSFIGRALERNGWTCIAVESGQAALDEIERSEFDLIFLDLVMPGMNGPDAFRKILEVRPDARVVIVTAHPHSDLFREAMESGPFVVLIKPFGLTEIRNVVTTFRPND